MEPRKLYHLPSLLLLLILNAAVSTVNGVGDEYTRADFPSDFVFGSSVSAYQYEGAAFEDGRTASIWDTWTHAGGYRDGATGDVASDGYHKYKDDVQLMVDTGLEAFRFSISWSRLIPNGRGSVNPNGLQFYNDFIDELIHHGIQPHATLSHIDLPQVLQDEYGGWLSRKIVSDFTAYADVCFKEFGNRVLHWTTVNEPNIFAMGGYDVSTIPPGRCSPPFGFRCNGGNSTTEPYIAAHNMLLAHSSVARLYRTKYKATQHGFIGISIFSFYFAPYTNATIDAIATERANEFFYGWILNPLIFGDYPAIMKKNAGTRIPTFTEHESKQLKGSIDFVGVIHYTINYVKDKSENLQIENRDYVTDVAVDLISTADISVPKPLPLLPSGLYGVLEYIKRAYNNIPVYVHENGQRSPWGETLNDTERVEYLQAYIGSSLDALRNGSNLKGYFTWSFLDVLELLDGFQVSYGLYYVDLNDKNLTRYPKLSACWYSKFLNGRGSRSNADTGVARTASISSKAATTEILSYL